MKTIRRRYTQKFTYANGKTGTSRREIICSAERAVSQVHANTWEVLLHYKDLDRDLTNGSYQESEYRISFGRDGSLSFSEEGGEHFVYLYPEQVKLLKELMRTRKRFVHSLPQGK